MRPGGTGPQSSFNDLRGEFLRLDNVILLHRDLIRRPGLDPFLLRFRVTVAREKVVHFSFRCHSMFPFRLDPEFGQRGEGIGGRPQKVGQSQMHYSLCCDIAQPFQRTIRGHPALVLVNPERRSLSCM